MGRKSIKNRFLSKLVLNKKRYPIKIVQDLFRVVFSTAIAGGSPLARVKALSVPLPPIGNEKSAFRAKPLLFGFPGNHWKDKGICLNPPELFKSIARPVDNPILL